MRAPGNYPSGQQGDEACRDAEAAETQARVEEIERQMEERARKEAEAATGN